MSGNARQSPQLLNNHGSADHPNLPSGKPHMAPFKTLAQLSLTNGDGGPIKAFPTPNNANGNILMNDDAKSDDETEAIALNDGEQDMKMFVLKLEEATRTENGHQQMLYLKRIRLHHKVLSGVSFNAFKMMIDFSNVTKLRKGEKLYRLNENVDRIFFVLYGSMMVKFSN